MVRTRESLLERRVRVHSVEGRDKAELFLDLLFGRHVRRGSVRVVVLPALCGLAQALALWGFDQDRTRINTWARYLFREHLDIRRILVPHIALFFVQVQQPLFVLIFVFLVLLQRVL